MKSQKIPEHKLNFTTTAGQAVENITSDECSKVTAVEKTQAKQGNAGQGTSDTMQ